MHAWMDGWMDGRKDVCMHVHGRYHGLGMAALANAWVGQHGRHCLSMDALANAWVGSMDVIIV